MNDLEYVKEDRYQLTLAPREPLGKPNVTTKINDQGNLMRLLYFSDKFRERRLPAGVLAAQCTEPIMF